MGMWWCVVILIAAGSLTYLNSLANPFVLDDEGTILENQQIRTLMSPAVLMPERELPVAGRPVVNVSFAVNYAMGGLNPAGYHVVNVAIHILCALLLFGLARRLLQRLRPGDLIAGHATLAALAIALLWLVHPLNSEAVDYLTQRTESMMALFYFLTLYAGLRAIDAPAPGGWPILAILACAMGMASKESMVTAPAMVVLIDRIFLFDSFAHAFRSRGRLYAGLAATWLVLAGLLATGPRSLSTGAVAGVSVWTYMLNQAPLIVRYLRLTMWPASLVANYGWPVALRLRDVLPSALFVLALLALTAAALRWRPRIGFLGAWFFITLAPTSSIVPIATEVGAERRMYLPVAALIALAVVAAARGWEWARPLQPERWRGSQAGRTIAVTALIGVAAAFAIATIVRNRDYRSPLSIAQVTLDRYPTPSAHHVLAEYLLDAGQRDLAISHLRQALPGAPRAHYTLGVELYKEGHLDEAIKELQAFIQAQPHLASVIDAHGYLGNAFAAQKNWPAAIDQFRAILAITPDNPVADHSLADVLVSAENFDEAVLHYRRYLAEYPNDADALNQMGLALGSSGRLTEALVALRRAAALDRRDGAVQHNLAFALWKSGDLSEALAHARQAVALQPDDAGSRQLLQILLTQ